MFLLFFEKVFLTAVAELVGRGVIIIGWCSLSCSSVGSFHFGMC